MGPTWLVIVMPPRSESSIVHAALVSEFTDEAEARAHFEAQCKELPTAYVHLATARSTRTGWK